MLDIFQLVESRKMVKIRFAKTSPNINDSSVVFLVCENKMCYYKNDNSVVFGIGKEMDDMPKVKNEYLENKRNQIFFFPAAEDCGQNAVHPHSGTGYACGCRIACKSFLKQRD